MVISERDEESRATLTMTTTVDQKPSTKLPNIVRGPLWSSKLLPKLELEIK
jgi:hypothetical protein